MTVIAICAATFQRPRGLTALLDSLKRLEIPPGVELRTVVVDNDPDASARPIMERASRTWPHADLRYAVEEQRGIPFARNCSIRAAGDFDWAAFIDDDAVADPAWIRHLYETAEAFHAEVVTGAVIPVYEVEPPQWIKAGHFFERTRFPTGTPLHYARTTNALVAARWLAGGSPFNEAMANNGGDDTHLFRRIHLAGGKIVWSDEAIVLETVPKTRLSAQWLIKREYRRGNSRSLCLRDLEDSPVRRAKRLAAAAVHSGAGVGLMALAPVRGRQSLVLGAQRVALSAGLVSGLTGHVYEEYSVVHGS
ncbi:MAG TPA: glycosyltransferase [Actinomycetes bacterium]|nr:glycosyltransferase [Actinomycetes bacterium]